MFAASLAEALDPTPSPYLNDPEGWAESKGIWLWSKPREILQSVRDNRMTVVHAGHGISKSHTAAVAAAWWVDVHYKMGKTRIVTTADNETNIKAVLWQELNRLHADAELVGRILQKEWWIGSDMVGLGKKPADYDPTGIHGLHAEYLLVIIDEIAGVPRPLVDACLSLASGDEDRVLALGNPDFAGSMFDQLRQSGVWYPIHMDVMESPNLTGESVPPAISRALTGRLYVQSIIDEHGEESPVYQAKVRGDFPQNQDLGVVRWSDLVKCRAPLDLLPEDRYPIHLGVDVGAGGDWTVVRERRGPVIGREWIDKQADTMEGCVALVLHALGETGATHVKIDNTPIGKGAYDRLRQLRAEKVHSAEIVGVNVGTRSRDPKRFVRLRDQLWWEIGRKLSEDHAWDFSEAENKEMVMSQLAAPAYELDSSGRVKVEQKDDTKKRIGRSPDNADALLLAFYMPVNAVVAAPADDLKSESYWKAGG